MQRTTGRWIAAGIALLALTALTAPAFAAEENGFELYVGSYMPEDDDLFEDETTYGLRFNTRYSSAFGLEASIGRFEFSDDDPLFSVDAELILVDLSAQLIVNGGGTVEWLVYGGPGYAFANVDVSTPFGGGSESDDSFTANAGTGLKIALGKSVYLRPDIRARWFEQSEDVDTEASLALGFSFGGH